jgi:hypothetical protein
MQMTFRATFAALTLGAILFAPGCKKDPATAEENITTIEVHLTGPGFDKKFYWNDTDGDGVANVLDTIAIPALTGNIQAHLHVYDRSSVPEIDLTEEIEEESVDHLFVYAPNVNGLTIGSLNTDTNGKPFGVESVWESGQPGSGTLNLKLYHEPTNKDDSTNPGGNVDFDVTFPVKVN